jgi:hypothetical protein
MQMYWPYFYKYADPKKLTLLFITEGGCPAIPKTRDNRPYRKICPKFIDLAMKLLNEDTSISKVVISSAWVSYFHPLTQYYFDKPENLLIPSTLHYKSALNGLGEMIKKISKNRKVFFITNVPLGNEFDPKHMLRRRFSWPAIEVTINEFNLGNFNKKHQIVLNDLKEVASQSGAIILDPVPSLCPQNVCPVITEENIPISKDNGHIRPFYIIEKGHFLSPIL